MLFLRQRRINWLRWTGGARGTAGRMKAQDNVFYHRHLFFIQKTSSSTVSLTFIRRDYKNSRLALRLPARCLALPVGSAVLPLS
ncbi:hypothetical protein E2C01_036145 [Portunus trituberculatus]|uniref:Uncharacterized protein n=1 Tax=Portunus trituberculatus TaxID=210409 RepID=A0A5B7FBN8_PORTR|nr:hypothetical protein [Portunus trituberculatus]